MKPYMAVDLMSGEVLGRFKDYAEAYRMTKEYEAVDIQYRPTARMKRK